MKSNLELLQGVNNSNPLKGVEPTKVADVNTNEVIAYVRDVYVSGLDEEDILELQRNYEDWYQRNKDNVSPEFDPNL